MASFLQQTEDVHQADHVERGSEDVHQADHVERGSGRWKRPGATGELSPDDGHGSVDVEVAATLSWSCAAVSQSVSEYCAVDKKPR